MKDGQRRPTPETAVRPKTNDGKIGRLRGWIGRTLPKFGGVELSDPRTAQGVEALQELLRRISRK